MTNVNSIDRETGEVLQILYDESFESNDNDDDDDDDEDDDDLILPTMTDVC